MLYDPTRDIPSLLNVERFKNWLDTQPPQEWYSYGSFCNCAIAQYLKWHIGDQNIRVHSTGVKVNDKYYVLPPVMDHIAVSGERTFGAAAERAAQALTV